MHNYQCTHVLACHISVDLVFTTIVFIEIHNEVNYFNYLDLISYDLNNISEKFYYLFYMQVLNIHNEQVIYGAKYRTVINRATIIDRR